MNKDKIKELIFTTVEASDDDDWSGNNTGKLVGYSEETELPFILVDEKYANKFQFWKYIREIKEPKLVQLTHEDYNGEPVRPKDSKDKYYPTMSYKKGVHISDIGVMTWEDLLDYEWQWFSNGKWQRMAKVEGGER